MDKLKRMAIFATVAESGSMSGAARALGMTTSAVSQHIRQLEAETGVTLLHRSTRKLALSEAGRLFYQGCADMLQAARQAEQRLSELRDAPVGELRIATPTGFAGQPLTAALAPLLAAHPRLSLRLFVSDRRIDLIEHRIDLAIRIGAPQDSSLIARHLADWRNILCAAPDYLARRPAPVTPAELLQHDWLALDAEQGMHTVELCQRDGEALRLKVTSRIASSDILSIRALTLAGLGISAQPEPEIRRELARGELVPLLPDWQLPGSGVYAVTPRRGAQPAKVRHAIDALRRSLQDGGPA